MKQFISLFIFIVALGGSALFTHLWYRTDDTSVRYNLWKVSLWPKPDHLLGGLIADNGAPLRNMLKEEIKELFPGAHENAGHNAGPRYEFEKHYIRDIKGREHIWLCPSEVIAIFENGKFQYLYLAKG